jgi:hypothetical protein
MEVVHMVVIGAAFFQWLRDIICDLHMPPEADAYSFVLCTSDDILLSVRSTLSGRWKTPDCRARTLSVATLLDGEQEKLVTHYTSARSVHECAEKPFAAPYTARLRLVNQFLPDQHDMSRPLGLSQAALEQVVSGVRARVCATHLPPGDHTQPNAAEQAVCVEVGDPKLPAAFLSG